MAKDYSRSVRFTKEVYDIVDSIDPKNDNFSEKFEIMCLKFKNELPDREKKIKKLDSTIAEKEKYIDELNMMIREREGITGKFKEFMNYIKCADNVINRNTKEKAASR